MTTKKLSYPKPLPSRGSSHAPTLYPGVSSGSTAGWMLIFIVALAFVAMITLVLGSTGRT